MSCLLGLLEFGVRQQALLLQFAKLLQLRYQVELWGRDRWRRRCDGCGRSRISGDRVDGGFLDGLALQHGFLLFGFDPVHLASLDGTGDSLGGSGHDRGARSHAEETWTTCSSEKRHGGFFLS